MLFVLEPLKFQPGDRVRVTRGFHKGEIGTIAKANRGLAQVQGLKGWIDIDYLEVIPPEQSAKQVKVRLFLGGETREILGTISPQETQVEASSIDGKSEIHTAIYQPSGTVTIAYEWDNQPRLTQLPIDRLIELDDQLFFLEQERDRLAGAGLAEPGTWIEVEKVHKRQWRQAKWCSSKPVFPSRCNPEAKVRSKYIGKENSPEHKAAIALYHNRKGFDRLTKQINQLEEKLNNATT